MSTGEIITPTKKEDSFKISKETIRKRIEIDRTDVENLMIDERWLQRVRIQGKGNQNQLELALGKLQAQLKSKKDHIKFLEKLLEE